MNISTNKTYSLADEDWNEFKKNGIPITVYLIFLCVLGTIGNVHVFMIYLLRYNESVFKTFIMCLAAVDFLGCSFVVPASLYIVRYPNSIQSSSFCKASLSLSYFVGSYSLLLLDCVAVERYRKVCQATRTQMTLKMTRIICGLFSVLVVGIVLIPIAIIYGINQKITKPHSLSGYECNVLDIYKSCTLTLAYRGFVFFLFVLLMAVAVVLYTLVGRRIYAQKKKYRNASKTEYPVIELTQAGITSISLENDDRNIPKESTSGDDINSMSVPSATSCSILSAESQTVTLGAKYQGNSEKPGPYNQPETGKNFLNALREKKSRSLDKSINMTMVFLVVSIISFGCYFPYLVIILITSFNEPLHQNFVENYGALDAFIRLTVFLNNAVNPYVYGFMDKKIRKELSRFYVRTLHCSFGRK
ncbi:gastrin/cholecystokinin type B receptor-like [Argopecten irradians]|uniref:gastrin/cholecystokinin type B receptor-like n=1 Tax=Argopecten irradians TaxID=31199 RepID=UPI003712E68A